MEVDAVNTCMKLRASPPPPPRQLIYTNLNLSNSPTAFACHVGHRDLGVVAERGIFTETSYRKAMTTATVDVFNRDMGSAYYNHMHPCGVVISIRIIIISFFIMQSLPFLYAMQSSWLWISMFAMYMVSQLVRSNPSVLCGGFSGSLLSADKYKSVKFKLFDSLVTYIINLFPFFLIEIII